MFSVVLFVILFFPFSNSMQQKEILSPDPFSPIKQPSNFGSPYDATPTASSLTVAQLLQREKEANASATTKVQFFFFFFFFFYNFLPAF